MSKNWFKNDKNYKKMNVNRPKTIENWLKITKNCLKMSENWAKPIESEVKNWLTKIRKKKLRKLMKNNK